MFRATFGAALTARLLFVGVAIAAIAACSGGGSGSQPGVPATLPNGGANAYPTPTPTPPPAPTSISTSVPLSLATSGNAISAAPIPAPTGYSSHITVPQVSAPAGTTIAITSSVSLPTALPILQGKSRIAQSVRIPQAASGLVPIFFDSLVPSQTITVAGAVSITQAFPAGTLSTSTGYYLGFYDSTQPSPAWQTIAGPITSSDGLSLTFGGNVGSTALQANQLYGFAIFSLGASSTTTPPPAPQTLAYLAGGTSGLVITNVAGASPTTLPIDAGEVALDDSGNIYALQLQPTPAPAASGATPSPQAPPIITQYAPGSATVKASYTPSNPDGLFIISAGTGAFAVGGTTSGGSFNAGGLAETFDVWDPGVTGAPSRTINEPSNGVFFGIMGHDGTLFLPHANSGGTFNYDVFAPGSSTVTRTISETIVSPAQQPYFNPNYAAVGPDGTLYVTEYSFIQPDALAGLYIYPPSGAEKFVATTSNANGPGPEGVDIDASGNIYVVNNNSGYNATAAQFDTLHDIEVFGPGGSGGPNGAASPAHITGNFTAYPIAVSADGSAFISSFPFPSDPNPIVGSFGIPAGTSTVNQIASFGTSLIVLYDGNRETTSIRRTAASISSSAASVGGGGPRAHALAIQRRMAALGIRR